MKELLVDCIPSPIGTIVIVVDGDRLCSLDFEDYTERMMRLLKRRYAEVQLKHVDDPHGFSTRIANYFEGDFESLTTIPVNTGGTPFQQQVWTALRDIPVGQTVAYSRLAARIGKPAAARAVGMTNSLNPVALVLPCHRVVGCNASLTGYAGGLDRKRWLLRHENAILNAKVGQ
ncbi:MAG TPA: methylated-DNA--[protein]-cysteine S-methyltransferase [Geobacteraceae bacterium]|nr:methylated-DNA--[protein]-cysteine S-methyltransferase [Geobacteraceae bacterium]